MWQILTISAAIIYGIIDLISKHVLKDTKEIIYCTLYSIFGGLFYLLFINQFSPPTENIGWILMIISSIFWTITVFSFSAAYKNLDISLASPIINTNPALIFILSVLFLKESYNITKAIGIIIIIIGSIIITHKHKKKYNINKKGIFYLITTIIAISIAKIIDKIAIQYFNIYFYGFLVFIIPGLIYLIFALKNKNDFNISKKNWLLLFLIGFLSFFGYYLILNAYNLTEISNVVPLQNINILVVMFGGFIIYKENNIIKKLIGGLLIILGVILIV